MMQPEFDQLETTQYNQLKAEFSKYCQSTLYPFLQKKEKLRNKYVSQFWFFLLMAIAVVPVLVIGAYFLGHYYHQDINVSGLILIAGFISAMLIRWPYKQYYKTVKQDVMDLFIRFFPDFKYTQGSGLNAQEMAQSKIFPVYDNAHADDCFAGRHENVGIRICEQILTRTIQTKKGSHNVTVFQGIAVELAMNKNFKGHTVVIKDRGIFLSSAKYRDLEKVKLEDIEFEKAFDVYSTDQIEARYLLTPAFMERVKRLQQLFGGRQISVSFRAQKIMIVVDTRENMFEPCAFFKTNLNMQRLDKVFDEFWTIFSIIHILKLNPNIEL